MNPALTRNCGAIFPAVLLSLLTATTTPAAEFKLNGHTFTLPDGFTIELAAGTNLVSRPISADFDEQGRLYVTDSSGSNEKPDKQLIEKPHRIVRLEDTDGDGVFDKPVVFADKMMFPEGAMWLDGSLYVAAPPSIWKLTDTNNDGVADVREEWFKGKTLTGCANDLHGPYLGPDGWIYWCKGAFAEQEIPHYGKPPTRDKAAHIFRARPDGSQRESFLAGGMDNPVEIAWNNEGELFFTCTFIQNPGGGKRDALVHGIYGGVYGKVHDVIDPLPRTGELLEPMTHLGPAAPSGLCSYKSRVFGAGFRENLFVTQFNLRKVSRHILEPDGATFRTRDSDFLVSDNHDFHPTDVLEDADGSLLVIDTGGWYKICCPTSQLAKPDVLGAIYRIRRTGAKLVSDPRGLKIQWEKLKSDELANLLGDERAFVRKRAVYQLSKQAELAVPALRNVLLSAPKKKSMKGWGKKEYFDEFDRIETARQTDWPNGAAKRQSALWVLTRIASPKAREAVRLGFKDVDSGVRSVAFQSASLHRDGKAAEVSEPSADIFIILNEERLYFELLGRADAFDKSARVHLHSMIDTDSLLPSENRFLQHSFSYALIEANSVKAARQFLQDSISEPGIKPAVLIALDQMPGGNLKAAEVIPLLNSTDTSLKKTAMWIIGHHPEWGGETSRWIQDWFKPISSVVERPQFVDILARSARQPEVQQRLVEMAGQHASQATALSAMARSRVNPVPASWGDAVRDGLQSKHGEANQRLALSAASAFASAKKNQTDLTEPLLAFARDTAHPKELRLMALTALPGGSVPAETDIFNFLRAELSPTNSATARSAAAGVLSKARLDESQLLTLVDSVKSAGPIELPKMLGAFDRTTNENVGFALVAALETSKSRAALRVETVKPHLTKFSDAVQQKAETLLASLNVDATKQKARLDELSAHLTGGDVRRGQAVFNSAKASCTACHAIGYVGGNVGPDLTKIGQIRTERDLLEAIVFPSASFVRSYEPMIVVTKDGEEFSGIVRGDSPEGVTLVTGPNAEQRIARANIAELRPGTVSVMPGGLDEQLSRQELADLVAFLKATK